MEIDIKYLEAILIEKLQESLRGKLSQPLYTLVKAAIQEATTKQDAIEQLRVELKTKVVHFAYYKIDGEYRGAWGTLKDSLIVSRAYGYSRRINNTRNSYFDLEKNEWRCFKSENFIGIV